MFKYALMYNLSLIRFYT